MNIDIKYKDGREFKITFDSDRHKYFLDGRELHGGSSMAEITGNNGWRIPWAAKRCAEVAEREAVSLGLDELKSKRLAGSVRGAPYQISSEATDFGHAVHEWLQRWITYRMGGTKPQPPKAKELKDAIRPYLAWEKKHQPKYLSSEEVVYCAPSGWKVMDDYAGTLDLRFILSDQHCLGDFKSSKQISREYIFQCALYAYAKEQQGEKIDQLYIFRLPKIMGDKIEIVKFPFTDVLRESAVAISRMKHLAVEVDQWLKGHKKKEDK